MKVLAVSQYYRPEDAHVVNELTESLAARGHEVVVVTGFPNYPKGRIFDGYHQSFRHTEHDGAVKVIRVPLVISHSRNPIGRILNYLSFAVATLLASRLAFRSDVVYVYATQMTAAIAPWLWKIIGGPPYVLHVQDLWPESITQSGMTPARTTRAIEIVLHAWLRQAYGRAAATIAIAPTMLVKLLDRGVPSDRGHVVLNWARHMDGEAAPEAGSLSSTTAHRLTVMYAGTLGDFQDLDTAILAAKLVDDLPGFTLSIVGEGVAEQRLRRLATELDCRNVEFLGRVPSDAMRPFYDRSDFQLVSLKDIEIFHGTIPSKFQASVSLGVPVITAVPGDLADIVTEHRLGLAVPPEDPAALADAFRTAYALSLEERQQLGTRASDYYEQALTRVAATSRIEKILQGSAERKDKR